MRKTTEIREFDVIPDSDLLDEVLAVGDSSFFTEPAPTDVEDAETESTARPTPSREDAPPRRNGSVKTDAPARDGKSAVRALAAAGALLAAAAIVTVVITSGGGESHKPLAAQTPDRTPVSAATGVTPIAAPKRPQAAEPVRKTRSRAATPKRPKRHKRTRPAATTAPAAAARGVTPRLAQPSPPSGYSGEFSLERYGQ